MARGGLAHGKRRPRLTARGDLATARRDLVHGKTSRCSLFRPLDSIS